MTLAILAASTAAVLIAAFGASRLVPREIQTEVQIDAPVEAVWQQLTDIGSYGDWNPFVRDITGTLAKGERLKVSIQPPGKSAMTFYPKVLVFEATREFRWLGKLGIKGLFDGEHYFVIAPNSEGGATLHHGERFRGVLAPVLLALIGSDTKVGFEAMNAALKARTEAR